jgi:hypothetical protein
MTVLSIEVIVPGSINPEYVALHGRECLKKFVEDLEETIKRDDEMERVLESDEALNTYAQKLTSMELPPIVRAGTYRDHNQLPARCEIWSGTKYVRIYYSDVAHPRRPVWMKGAVAVLQDKYDRQSEYGNQVIRRYLRRIRFTAFEGCDETSDFIFHAFMRLRYRTPKFDDDRLKDIGQWYISDEWRDGRWHQGAEKCRIWLLGKHVTVTRHQFTYLKRLYQIVENTRKLEGKLIEMSRAA